MFAHHSAPQASEATDGPAGSRGSACLSHFSHIILLPTHSLTEPRQPEPGDGDGEIKEKWKMFNLLNRQANVDDVFSNFKGKTLSWLDQTTTGSKAMTFKLTCCQEGWECKKS